MKSMFDDLFDDEAMKRAEEENAKKKEYMGKLWKDPHTNPAIKNIIHCARFLGFKDALFLYDIVHDIENDPQFKDYEAKSKTFSFEALEKTFNDASKGKMGESLARVIYKNSDSVVQLTSMSLSAQERRNFLYQFIIERTDLQALLDNVVAHLVSELYPQREYRSAHNDNPAPMPRDSSDKLQKDQANLIAQFDPAHRERVGRFITFHLNKAPKKHPTEFWNKHEIFTYLERLHRCSPTKFEQCLNEFEPCAVPLFALPASVALSQAPQALGKREERTEAPAAAADKLQQDEAKKQKVEPK